MVAIETASTTEPGLAQLEPGDGEALERLFYRLSPETVYRRFMSPLARPEQARPERLLDVDHRDREAIVAVVEGEIVGVARYSRKPGTDLAEMAVVVADDYQKHGLGTRLLAALGDRATRAGITRFSLTMLADNRAAVRLMRRFDPTIKLVFSGGVYEATVPVRPAGGAGE
jgi:RimJ/RimL family protein N-acetyltransferase